MRLQARIEQAARTATGTRSTIAQVLQNQDLDLQALTIQQFADLAGVSKASLVRFAQDLGFSGWRPLANALMREREREGAHPSVDVNLPFGAADGTATIIERIRRVRMESTEHTAALQDPTTMARAANAMLGARQLVLYGLGANRSMLKLLAHKLLTIGIVCIEADQPELSYVTKTLNDRDCAVVLSYSGDNIARFPMCHLAQLKENHTYIIGITREGDNYLRSMATVTLSIPSSERLYTKVGAFSSEAAVEYLLDTLFSCVFARMYNDNLLGKVEAARYAEATRWAAGEKP